MNSHTSNTYIETDNLLQIATAHKPQNPLPHIPCLQAAHTRINCNRSESVYAQGKIVTLVPKTNISNAPYQLSLPNHFYNLYTLMPKFTHNMKYHNGGILNAQYKANSLNLISTPIYTYYECWQSPSSLDNTLITLIASTVY